VLFVDNVLEASNTEGLVDPTDMYLSWQRGHLAALTSKVASMDAKLYNRALSPAEIQQLYKLGQVIIRR
jgi:hypothetical protein